MFVLIPYITLLVYFDTLLAKGLFDFFLFCFCFLFLFYFVLFCFVLFLPNFSAIEVAQALAFRGK